LARAAAAVASIEDETNDGKPVVWLPLLLLLEADPWVMELPVEVGLVMVVIEAVFIELGPMLRGLAWAAPAMIAATAIFIMVIDIVDLDCSI
jgi:hypothetical protein